MTETILEIKNLKKSYGKNEVLKDISLSVKKGEVISIIGSSGSGKSTFLRSINLLESPSGGEILYHGDNVLEKGYDLTTYRERLGMVFQSFNLFENLNVLENAIVAQTTVLKRDRKEAESIAKANLEKVGMGEQYWKAKPKQLSGGQKRLLAFVLCLIGKPDILFLDEPTAGLDPKERVRFRNLISAFSKDRIVILSTHIVSDVEFIAEDIIMMKDGQILHFGKTQEITTEIDGQVWECTVPTSRAEQYSETLNISNLRNIENNCTVLRVISEQSPMENAIKVEPTLEDLYLFYFKGVNK